MSENTEEINHFSTESESSTSIDEHSATEATELIPNPFEIMQSTIFPLLSSSRASPQSTMNELRTISAILSLPPTPIGPPPPPPPPIEPIQIPLPPLHSSGVSISLIPPPPPPPLDIPSNFVSNLSMRHRGRSRSRSLSPLGEEKSSMQHDGDDVLLQHTVGCTCDRCILARTTSGTAQSDEESESVTHVINTSRRGRRVGRMFARFFGNLIDDTESQMVRFALEQSFIEDQERRLIDSARELDIQKLSYANTHKKLPKCMICFEEFDNNDEVGLLECNHFFHHECIQEWGKRKASCPFCSVEIPTVQNQNQNQNQKT